MKTCSRCGVEKPLTEFVVRRASKDGYTPACAECLRTAKRVSYATNPEERIKAVNRATKNKQARLARDPIYRRAYRLWIRTKRRTKIPPWVAITDFLPACRKAIRLGTEYEIDHIIPLSHPLVCGLHTPNNVRVVRRDINFRKGNTFHI